MSGLCKVAMSAFVEGRGPYGDGANHFEPTRTGPLESVARGEAEAPFAGSSSRGPEGNRPPGAANADLRTIQITRNAVAFTNPTATFLPEYIDRFSHCSCRGLSHGSIAVGVYRCGRPCMWPHRQRLGRARLICWFNWEDPPKPKPSRPATILSSRSCHAFSLCYNKASSQFMGMTMFVVPAKRCTRWIATVPCSATLARSST